MAGACPHDHELDRESALAKITTSILRGRCVAFVGAGFAMPAIPGWKSLLKSAAEDIGVLGELQADIDGADAFRLEAIAQTLADASEGRLAAVLQRHLKSGDAKLELRTRLLSEIPFKAVVTTNFDSTLDGHRPDARRLVQSIQGGSPVWARVVAEVQSSQPDEHPKLESRSARLNGARVVKLHGNIGDEANQIVLTRREYRRLVHGRGGYMPLLSALLGTSDVLFLGTSFTDAYLNELRQQVVKWVEESEAAQEGGCVACQLPVSWWALMPDVSASLGCTLAKSDGLRVISYKVGRVAGKTEEDHGAFDEFLKDLNRQASFGGLLRKRMDHSARRTATVRGSKEEPSVILWYDPSVTNNEYGERFLREALGPDRLLVARDLESFKAMVLARSPMFVITRQGRRSDTDSDAREILEYVRSYVPGTPVIVFAGRNSADENRWRMRSLGAVDYCHRWQDLFRVMGELLESDEERDERLDLRSET
jgi:hypothetical protein